LGEFKGWIPGSLQEPLIMKKLGAIHHTLKGHLIETWISGVLLDEVSDGNEEHAIENWRKVYSWYEMAENLLKLCSSVLGNL